MFRRVSIVITLLGLGVVIGWGSRDWLMLTDVWAQPPSDFSVLPAPGERGSRFGSNLVSPPPTALGGIALGEEYSPEELINISVYEQCNRSVVNISTRTIRPDSFLMITAVEGSGSGSILDNDGHILTNYHVIEGARDIKVALFNGEVRWAESVVSDPENDIAILKINAPKEFLQPIVMGDSASLRIGQRIIAIGNPFGLERTMTTGIISSLNRQLPSRNNRTMKSIIQIDAALNQGNSGGPLLNSRGQLIGMNTAIATNTGDNAGIGFAIPVNTIKRVVPQLIRDGRVIRPTIGITSVFESELGLQVVQVTPNGPAEKAGIRGFAVVRQRRGGIEFLTTDKSSADLIVGLDGVRVKTADDFLSMIENKKAGDQLRLSIIRRGKPENVVVTLGGDE